MTSSLAPSTSRASTSNLIGFVAFQLLVALVPGTTSYKLGPPVNVPELCSTMHPQHGNYTRQTTAAPFAIAVSGPNGATCYTPGTPITVTLSAVDNHTTFAGFLMEARPSPTVNASYGTFNSNGNQWVSPYNCFGQNNNVIGHKGYTDSKSTVFTWTAQADYSGSITLLATVVEETDEFWVQGVQLNVGQCPSTVSTTTVGVRTTSNSATVARPMTTVVMATFLFLWQVLQQLFRLS